MDALNTLSEKGLKDMWMSYFCILNESWPFSLVPGLAELFTESLENSRIWPQKYLCGSVENVQEIKSIFHLTVW